MIESLEEAEVQRDVKRKLPDEVLARGLKLSETMAYLDIPLKDFSREELLAIAAELIRLTVDRLPI